MDAPSILEVCDLTLELGGRRILDHLSFEVWPGYVHAVVGPNGAGKSTLAATIMGLRGYEPAAGEIRWAGQSLAGWSVDARARSGITLAWQEPARFEGLSVAQFLAAGARDSARATPHRALEQVGLAPEHYLTRAVDKTLSGGERKRIELASILVMHPRLVLLDEPDSGIDVEALERIFAVMRALKAQGTTVLLITHSLAVLRQAEHAFLLCGGRLVEKGPVEQVARYFSGQCAPCERPNHPEEQA